jgi:hypothetical protein
LLNDTSNASITGGTGTATDGYTSSLRLNDITAESGAIVEYKVTNGTGATAASGQWKTLAQYNSEVDSLADGNYTLQARVKDSNGNYSAASAALGVTKDSVANPLSLSFTDSGNGAEGANSDGVTNTPVLTVGTAETGAVVQFQIGAGTWMSLTDYTAAMVAGGASGSDGLKTVKVRQVDKAGNTSDPTSVSFTLDRTGPSTAIVTGALASESDSGSNTSDFITLITNPVYAGVAEAGAKVAVTVADLTYTTTANAVDGSWRVQLSSTTALTQNTYTPTIVVTDKAGNATSAINGTAFTVDTIAPSASLASSFGSTAMKAGDRASVTITFTEAVANFGLDDLVVAGGQLSNLTRTKAASAGSTNEVWTVTFTPNPGVNAGSASISLAANRYTDVAGNPNTAQATLSMTYDTSAPSVQSIVRGASSLTNSTLANDAYLNATELAANQTASFTATFSESVKGLSSSNFRLVTQSGLVITGPSLAFAAISPDADGRASRWTITVAGLNTIDATLCDSLKLELISPSGIADSMVSSMNETCPPIRSASAGPLPL